MNKLDRLYTKVMKDKMTDEGRRRDVLTSAAVSAYFKILSDCYGKGIDPPNFDVDPDFWRKALQGYDCTFEEMSEWLSAPTKQGRIPDDSSLKEVRKYLDSIENGKSNADQAVVGQNLQHGT